jgi:hypothetical protein
MEVANADFNGQMVGVGVARDLTLDPISVPSIGEDDGRTKFRLRQIRERESHKDYGAC